MAGFESFNKNVSNYHQNSSNHPARYKSQRPVINKFIYMLKATRYIKVLTEGPLRR